MIFPIFKILHILAWQFLDARASLKTMFKIHSGGDVFKISRLQSIREFYRVLQSVTEYYRVLQSITEYYKDKSSASTWTNFWAC